MEQWKKNLYVLWFGTFVAAVSFTLVTPFLPIFVREELGVVNNIEIWSGVLVSASMIASATMSPIWGALADKYGRKIMIIRSGIGIGVTYLLSAFVSSVYVFLLLRFMMGVLSGFIPSSIALVATNTPEEKISHSLGILQTGIAAGGIMGPLIGGLLSFWFGIRGSIFVGGVVILFGTLLVLFGVKETAIRSKEKTNVVRDLKVGFSNKQLMSVLFILMAVQASLYMIQPVLPLYLDGIVPEDMDLSLITGIVYSLLGVATILAAPRWSARGEKVGLHQVLVIGLFGGALFNLAQLLFPSVVIFGGWRFAFGLCIAGVVPAINSLIAKSVEPSFRGRAFGISTSFNQLGIASGPIIGGFIGKFAGLPAVFITASMILAGAAGIIQFKRKQEVQQGKKAYEVSA